MLGSNLSFIGNPDIYEVTINATSKRRLKWRVGKDYKNPISIDIPDAGLVLASGTTGTDDIPWSIKIVAGNVPADTESWTDISNTASLVTTATIGNDRVVLTGDSTVTTLNYVRANYGTSVYNPTILQIPHHGSLSSYPTDAILAAFNPTSGLISVGLLNDSYRLPRKSVVDKWLTASRLANYDRVVDYWSGDVGAYDTHTKLKAILTGPWSGYDVLHNNSESFYWLKDPDDAEKSGTGFYGFTNNFFFLYRKKIGKDIVETGIYPDVLKIDFDGS